MYQNSPGPDLAFEELRAWQDLQHVRQEVEHELAGLVAGRQQHVGRALPAEVLCGRQAPSIRPVVLSVPELCLCHTRLVCSKD